MPPAIKFQDEAAPFLTEAEHALLKLEKSPEDQGLITSVMNTLRTLRGVADLFNRDNANLILSIAADCFDTETQDTIPAELLNSTIILIDQIRGLDNKDFDNKESHNMMARLAPFANKRRSLHISSKQARDVRILVVDDEMVNRTLLVEFIKTFHPAIEITAVDSAAEAIYHYLTEDFDLVFLDIMMPELDGNHFITIVEHNRRLGNICGPANIVVQTAVQSLSELLNIVQHNCVLEVIRKPIQRERIATCISRYCTPFQAPGT